MAVAQTTLSAAIATVGVTSCTVRDVLGFAASTDTDDLVLIDSEFILVTGGLGTTSWTITRGYAGSTAATHLSGATVTRIARGYTDLSRIRNRYGFPDTDDDENLLDLIDEVNAEITQRLGIALYPATDTVRTYDGASATNHYRRLWIPGGIRTLTQVRLADSSNGTLTTGTLADFVLRPPSHQLRPGAPFTRIEIVPDPAGSYPWFPPYMANVEVTGTYGPAAAPANVARLADTMVVRAWNARGAGERGTPSVSKFIYADDVDMLEELRAEHASMVGAA